MLVRADPIDQYGSTANMLKTFYGGTCQYDAGTSRTGTASLFCNSNPGTLDWAGMTEGIVSFAFRTSGFNGNYFYFTRADGQAVLTWNVLPNGAIRVYRGNQGDPVIGDTFPGIIQIGSWSYLEMKFKTGAGGEIEFRQNSSIGTPNIILKAVGVNFMADPIVRLRMALNDGINLDDIVIMDTTGPGPLNDFIGDVRLRGRFATANGAEQDWAANGAATAFDCIDNVPPDPTKYISSSAAGDVSTFGLTPLPTNTSNIFAMCAFANVQKSDAGACSLTVGVNSNGAVAESAVINPGTGDTIQFASFPVDPDTGVAWQLPAAQAMLVRIERKS